MNAIQLPIADLKIALAGFQKVVNSKSALPVLGCVRVQPQTDGVDLQVTDLDSFVTRRIETPVQADFPPCLISFATLARVAKTSKEAVTLVHEGGERFKLRHRIGTATVEQSIDSVPVAEWPPLPQLKTTPFPVEPGFKTALRQAMECVSADSSRAILNGVCIDLTRSDCHCLVGTDGRHLFSANTFHFPLTESAVVPSRKFLNWSGFIDDGEWHLAVEPVVRKEAEIVTPAFIQIQSNRWTFLTRGIDGTYPNWRQVMPDPGRGCTRVELSDKAVGTLLDVLPSLPGSEVSGQPVTIAIRDGQLVLRSRGGANEDWTEIPIPDVSVSGSDQIVCLNRGFMTKALRFGFTEFELQDALSPILFTGPGKKMVAMPMRLEDAPRPEPDTAQTKAPSPAQAAETPQAGNGPTIPPPLQPENPTEQPKPMTTNPINPLPASERGELNPTNGHNAESPTGIRTAVNQVERIKASLRELISDLNETLDALKTAEKEKKATLKEVDSVRATLRSLQRVEL